MPYIDSLWGKRAQVLGAIELTAKLKLPVHLYAISRRRKLC